jgi:hypothetical protein
MPPPQRLTLGWSELAPTNAPVEDEPVQPVLRMNILPAPRVFFFHLMCFFFFTSSLPHLPPPSYPKPTSPSYLQPTNPTPPPSPELDLWSGSSSCGAVESEQELERPPDPRPHDQVKYLFFILFWFVLFEEASKLRSVRACCNLRSFFGSGACCCNAANSGHVPSDMCHAWGNAIAVVSRAGAGEEVFLCWCRRSNSDGQEWNCSDACSSSSATAQ